jgi:hypothetical protein
MTNSAQKEFDLLVDCLVDRLESKDTPLENINSMAVADYLKKMDCKTKEGKFWALGLQILKVGDEDE